MMDRVQKGGGGPVPRSNTARRGRARTIAIIAAVAAVLTAAAIAGQQFAERRDGGVAASPTPNASPDELAAGPTPTAATSGPEVVASATSAPSPRPSASPCPRASTTPGPVPTGSPAGGIGAYPLGVLCGEYAFVLNRGAITIAPGAVAEIWAIPLAGGEPRLVARYVNATSVGGISRGDNQIAQQLSPDGRRIVLSVVTPRSPRGERSSLFIVGLETGRTRMVGSDEADRDLPAWSPDGDRIAYVRRPSGSGSDDGIWIMNVDGTGARRVVSGAREFGSASHLYGWTPDGRIAWFHTGPGTLTLTDIDSGAQTAVASRVGDAHGLSLRSPAPRVAGSFTDTPNCPGTYVLVLDGAPERILAGAPDQGTCSAWHRRVRWNPARDEILYIREGSAGRELHVHELSGGTRRVAAQAEPELAEWSTAGTHLLYVHRDPQVRPGLPPRGTELRYVRRDGSDERTIFAPPAPASLSDLAVRLYPR